MIRTEKEAAVASIRDGFAQMSSAVFVNYAGLTVAQVEDLRAKFRERGVKYQVLKNTLIRKALAEESFVDDLTEKALKGMTGVALSYEEPSAAARILKEFVKSNDKLKIKAGLMDGAVSRCESCRDPVGDSAKQGRSSRYAPRSVHGTCSELRAFDQCARSKLRSPSRGEAHQGCWLSSTCCF